MHAATELRNQRAGAIDGPGQFLFAAPGQRGFDLGIESGWQPGERHRLVGVRRRIRGESAVAISPRGEPCRSCVGAIRPKSTVMPASSSPSRCRSVANCDSVWRVSFSSSEVRAAERGDPALLFLEGLDPGCLTPQGLVHRKTLRLGAKLLAPTADLGDLPSAVLDPFSHAVESFERSLGHGAGQSHRGKLLVQLAAPPPALANVHRDFNHAGLVRKLILVVLEPGRLAIEKITLGPPRECIAPVSEPSSSSSARSRSRCSVNWMS